MIGWLKLKVDGSQDRQLLPSVTCNVWASEWSFHYAASAVTRTKVPDDPRSGAPLSKFNVEGRVRQ